MVGNISAILQATENYKDCYVPVIPGLIPSNNGTTVNLVNSGKDYHLGNLTY